MMEVAQLPQPSQNLNSSVDLESGADQDPDQTVPTLVSVMPVPIPEDPEVKEGDLSHALVMDDSDNIDLDQNESILYQGPIFEMRKDMDADDFLIDPQAGLVKGNIKEKVKGFDEEEKKICPLVDRKSAILYDIVQQLEEEQLVQSLKILKTYKKPIIFPRELLDEEEGSYIGIKIVDPEEWRKKEEDRIIEIELDEQKKVLGDLQYIHDTYREPFSHGWTREVVVRVHATPPGAELGTFPLTSIGEVFYRDPAGNKIRSMKQIAISLEKMPAPNLSVKNFTFGKGPVGIKDQRKEIIRKIISGRSVAVTPMRPIAKGKKVSMNSASDMFNKNANVSLEGASPAGLKLKSSSSRRSIQPPKRYATGQAYMYPEKRSKTGTKKDVDYQSDNDMEMGMLPPKYPRGKEDYSGGGGSSGAGEEAVVKRRGRPPSKKADIKSVTETSAGYNGDNDSALFQISAFHNNSIGSSLFEGIENAQSEDGMYTGGMAMMDTEENNSMEEIPQGMEEQHHHHQGSEELLPCSIRCPGMTGEIPTLQCKRCLCLYHPECLALPPNLNFRNFLCGNCEGEHVEEMPRSSGAGHSMSHGGGKSGASAATSSGSGSEQQQQHQQQHKKTTPSWLPSTKSVGEQPVKVKKPPPPLLPAFPKLASKFHGHGTLNQKLKSMMPPKMGMLPPPSLGRGFGPNKNSINKISSSGMSMSMLRPPDDSMSISPITMKRGRGRPPKSSRLLPSLSNRNLTITPISIRTRLPVPNLAPMSKGNKSMPMAFLPPKMKNQQNQQQHQHQHQQQQQQQQQQQHSNQHQHQVLQQRLGGAPGPGLSSKGGRTMLPNLSGGSSSGPVRFQDNLFKEMSRGMKSSSSQPPMPIINKGPGGFPPFKRYPQSVVSIGTKKFVAVPARNDSQTGSILNKQAKIMKKSVGNVGSGQIGVSMPGGNVGGSTLSISPVSAKQQQHLQSQPSSSSPSPSQSQTNTNAMTPKRCSSEEVEEGTSPKGKLKQSPHKFDTDRNVIQQVFKYLSVKDLSRASRVSRLWNTVATNVNLWKIVRMKNHRISDVEAFTQFLKKQKTEQVDFRKMISANEMDWDTLFETLGSISSLKQIIIGPRTLSTDRVSELSQHCPNIEIVTS